VVDDLRKEIFIRNIKIKTKITDLSVWGRFVKNFAKSSVDFTRFMSVNRERQHLLEPCFVVLCAYLGNIFTKKLEISKKDDR